MLSEYSEGRKALEYYNEHQDLSSVYRGYITHCLVDFYSDRFGGLKVQDFDLISDQIVEYFPRELKDTYYRRVNGKENNLKRKITTKIKLVDRYYNGNRSSKKRRTSTIAGPEANINEPIVQIDENLELLVPFKLQLLYNKEDNFNTKDTWNRSFPLRRKDFQSNKTGSDILNEWPIIRCSFGDKLVKTYMK